MNTIIAKIGKTLAIGKQGENLVTRVLFPLVEQCRNEFGDGRFELLYERPNETDSYAVVTSTDDTNVIWDITSLELQKQGFGTCQLRYLIGENKVAVSEKYAVCIYPSLFSSEEKAPDPWSPWINDVLNAGTNAKSAAEKAAHEADEAWESALGAYECAENAAVSEFNAKKSEKNAEKSALVAKSAADNAEKSASAAKFSSDDARDFAYRASTAESNASMSCAAAFYSAEDASEKAAEANSAADDASKAAISAIKASDEAKKSAESANQALEQVKLSVVQETGQDAEKVMSQKAVTDELDKKEAVANKVQSIDENSTEEQYPSAEAVYNFNLPKRQTIIIDTPIWETQPTIEGTLNEDFKPYPDAFYYITLKDTDGTALEGGQFKLCTDLNGYASAYEQIFTVSDTSLISENKTVDFKSISDDRSSFALRDNAVNTIYINTVNPMSQRYRITASIQYKSSYEKQNCYLFIRDSIGTYFGSKIKYDTIANSYTGNTGFTIPCITANKSMANVFDCVIEIDRTISGFAMSISGMLYDRTVINTCGRAYNTVGDNVFEKPLTQFALGGGAAANKIQYRNGTAIIFEEFN